MTMSATLIFADAEALMPFVSHSYSIDQQCAVFFAVGSCLVDHKIRMIASAFPFYTYYGLSRQFFISRSS